MTNSTNLSKLSEEEKREAIGVKAGQTRLIEFAVVVDKRYQVSWHHEIIAQVLINPALDLRCNGILERLDDSHDNQRWQAIQYVTHLQDVDHPYVSPIVADLSSLPKTLIIIGEKDAWGKGAV